jgi:hypothetical protein
MRVLIVIAVLICATFMILLVLMGLARELSRLSYHSPPDLDDSDDWDIVLDKSDDTASPVFPCTQQWRASQNRIAGAQGYSFPGSSNAMDDLRSAL